MNNMRNIEDIIKRYTSDTLLSKEVLECALWEAYWKGFEDGRGELVFTRELSPYEAKNEE